VLDAVLDNAVKFSSPGDTITVHTVRNDDRVEIAVRDTGPGLGPDELERATDRFWRSPSQSNVDGSGLGLAIAARTVELAGGSLHLETPEGGGLRVVARLTAAGQDGTTAPDR
jgi:signal transduction histidine kinase